MLQILILKASVNQMVKKFRAFKGPEGSYLRSHEPATGPYTQPI
jgi:hypothetical protein